MNKLALGTVQFGLDYGVANESGQVSQAEAGRILSIAKENAIGLLDTAIAYGTSEEVLGRVGIDGFHVVTKLPSLPVGLKNIASWVGDQIKASLDRLHHNQLYGLLLHRPQDLLGSRGGELLQALTDIKNVGGFQKIGVSIYSPDQLDDIRKKIRIDIVQAPVNVLDRRLQSSGWLDRLKDDDIEVHARSVFLQGLLLMDRKNIPQKFSRWANLWDQWEGRLKREGISSLAACLAYPLSLEQVDQVIVGVDNALHLSKILEAAEHKNNALDTSFMSSEDLDLINPSNWSCL
jgi:aryl-alcohol dehydrogenase-like predicted oxidoreductase